ncbi:MAG: O-antigen ligase family protein [Acidobacteriota bacterium]|nr:MAG: O-antigen ligase family protein [Acidobacteriota bacterium]
MLILAAATTANDSIAQKSLLAFAIAIAALPRIAEGLSGNEFRVAHPGLLITLASVLLLAAAQTMPLPGIGTVSSDPYNTSVFIVVFGSLVIAFEVLSHYANTGSRIRVLAGLILAIGLLTAVVGLSGRFVPEMQNWILGSGSEQGVGLGQFPNRNHFALLLEMPVGLLLGLLIGGRHPGWKKLVGSMLLAVLVIGVVASSSRGGMVGVAAIFVFAVFVRALTAQIAIVEGGSTHDRSQAAARSRIGKIAVAAGLSVAVGLLIWTGIAFVGGDYVATRFERVDEELLKAEPGRVNRNAIWQSTIALIREKPLLGSGFGAYAEAIPRFDESSGRFHLEQAHNDYLEILAGGGAVGFALFGIFGVLASVRIIRNLRESDPERRQYHLGATAGIVGVLVHSFVDFGLHVMVNALVFTVLIVIATTEWETGPQKSTGTISRKARAKRA